MLHSKQRPHRNLPAIVLGWLVAATPAAADVALGASQWRADPELSVSATTNCVLRDGGSASFSALAATLGVSFEAADSPWNGGLFASYQASRLEQAHGMRSAGAWVKLDRGRWRATNWLAAVSIQGDPEQWLAGSGVRYEFARGGKLGLELMTPVDSIDGLRLALAWSGSLGEYLTLKMIAGSDSEGNADITATLEWSWDIL